MTNGVVNIIKPVGMSSAKLVSFVKHYFNGEKVGHFGTLDPNATGVLPVAVGKATRLFDYFLNKTKTYYAVFQFGTETDTLDSAGKIVKSGGRIPSKSEVEENCKKFIGKISQIPPQYSAKNINGERAYNLARRGETVKIKPKEIEIFSFDLINQIDEISFQFKIHCSSGTYIRSLCRDLAEMCGTVAFMPQLIRTEAGEFNLENAISLEDFLNGNFVVISISELLRNLPKVNLGKTQCVDLLNGKKIPFCSEHEKFALLCDDEILGIGFVEQGNLKIQTYLRS